MQCVKQIKFDTFSVLKNHYILDNNLSFNNNMVLDIYDVDDELYCKLNGFMLHFSLFVLASLNYLCYLLVLHFVIKYS